MISPSSCATLRLPLVGNHLGNLGKLVDYLLCIFSIHSLLAVLGEPVTSSSFDRLRVSILKSIHHPRMIRSLPQRQSFYLVCTIEGSVRKSPRIALL